VKVALVHMRHRGTGGTERYMNELAAHLARAGHATTIVCRSHEAAPHPDVRFAVLRSPAVGGAWRMWAFARDVERYVAGARADHDVVLGLGKTWTHDVLRMGGGCHATYVELAHRDTLRGLEPLVRGGHLKNRLALAIERRALAPGAYRRVIVNSRMVRDDVMRRHAVPADAIDVIYNGVDLERFRPERRATDGARWRTEAGLPERAFVLLFLGTGYGRKGLDRVLEALPAVRAARPDLVLAVVGYDSRKAYWEREAERLGVGQAVRFLGGRRDPEACYAGSDLYVLPTRYDPFANSTLEALASGLPVVTTTTNGGCELVVDGRHGAVVDPEADPAALVRALLEWSADGRAGGRAGGRAADARDDVRALAEAHGARAMTEHSSAVLQSVAARAAAVEHGSRRGAEGR
jgi:UDP-glucose:(heptosyl)LPS alpha-1,3-glucosyltransferase